MPWSGFPLADSTAPLDVTSWENCTQQFYKAIRERLWVLGTRYWPPPNLVRAEGFISAITDTTMSDATRAPTHSGGTFGSWVNTNPLSWVTAHPESGYAGNSYDQFSNPNPPCVGAGTCDYLPMNYDLIIGADLWDEPHIIRQVSINQNSFGTITFGSQDFTAAEITKFTGLRYIVVRSGGYGWHSRILWAPTPHYDTPGTAVGNAIQTITVTATEGTFTLTYDTTSTDIPFDADAATVQSAINPILIAGDSCTVTKSGHVYKVYLKLVDHADYVLMTADTSSLGSSGTVDITGTDNVICDSTKSWTTNKWVGKKIVFQRKGHAQYASITANDATTITTDTNFDIDKESEYVILKPVSTPRWWFGHGTDYAFNWYSGAQIAYPSHNPEGGMSSSSQALNHINKYTGEFCDILEQPNAFDRDVYSDATTDPCPDDTLAVADTYLEPNFWKSLRSFQVWCEAYCDLFVPDEDYAGKHDVFENFPPAYMFYRAGINAHATSISAVNPTDETVTIGSVDHGVPENVYVYWAIKHNDLFIAHGVQEMGPPEGSSAGTTLNVALDETHIGDVVYISYGWSRKIQRRFRRMYPHQYFLAVTGEDGGPLQPSSENPGVWPVIDASTTYSKTKDAHNPLNTTDPPHDIGFVIEGPEAFTEGVLARYSGTNFADPTVDQVNTLYATWIDKGTSEKKEQHTPMGDTGVATGGSTTTLIDRDKDFYLEGVWNLDPTESVATSGSATTLVDSTKSTDNRWDLGTNRWIDFILTVFVPNAFQTITVTATAGSFQLIYDGSNSIDIPLGASAAVVESEINGLLSVGDCAVTKHGNVYTAHFTGDIEFLELSADTTSLTGSVSFDQQEEDFKTPITGFEDDEQTLHFSADLGVTVVAGTHYRIDEPKYLLNRWRHRTLWITKPDGTTYDALITHSDDNTLWFEVVEGLTVEAGDAYQIVEALPGTVWEWNGTQWVVPGGWSAKDQLRKEPDTAARFGRGYKNDLVTRALFNEIYAAINQLTATGHGMSWTDKAEANVAWIPNTADTDAVRSCTQANYLSQYHACSAFSLGVWNDPLSGDYNVGGFEHSTPPSAGTNGYATRIGDETQEVDEVGADLYGGWSSYGKTSGIPILLASATDFYAKTQTINEDGPHRGEAVRTYNAYGSGFSHDIIKNVGSLGYGTSDPRFTTSLSGPSPIKPALVWSDPADPSFSHVVTGDMQVNDVSNGFRVNRQRVVARWSESLDFKAA